MSLRVWAAATAIASLFVVVPSQPVLAASGWDVVDSYYDSANAPSIGGGFDRVNRWNAPDGSVYVMGNAVGATTSKITHLSPPGVAFTRDDFTIGPGPSELPCYLNYECTVVDVAFDAQNRAYFVGTAVKPFVETVGFVLVLDRNENVVARAHKQVDGFKFLFRLVEFDETTGDLIVGGSSFSDFDSEERAVVVRINAIPLPADGQLTFDRSFDGDGVAVIDLGVNTLLRDVMANPDGSVYVLVRMLTVSDGKPITVVRKLSAVGVADRSFGLSGNGYPLGLSTSTPGNLARGSDGLYVLVKTDKAQVSIYEPRIIRMTLTGRVDTTFSGDGQVVFDALDSTWAGSPTEEFKVVFTLAGVLMVRVSELRGESRLTLYGLLANGDADTTFGSGGAIEFSSEELVWRGSEVTGDQQRITIRGVRTCRDPGACSLQGFISVVNTTFVARANATSGGGQGGQGTGNAGGAGASGGSSAVAGTTVAAPSALDAKATSRGVVVTWKASSTPGASYLVNVVGPETSKQCTVASSAATTCRFRRIPAWEKYSISVLASAGNAVSEGVTTSVKPFVSVKPRKTVKLSRLITSPRAKNEGRRMWSVRGGCRIDTVKGTMTAGPKAGSCTVKLVTGRSGGLPRISRSVTVMVG